MNQLQRLRAGRRTSAPETVPAPIKGWNTRDPFEEMDPLDAILLDNWYPSFAGLVMRNGSLNYITGLSSLPVKTIASLRSGSVSKLLAATNDMIFDITMAASPIQLGAGFQSDIWQTAVFNRHLFFVNGIDAAQIYDGAALTATGFTGAAMTAMVGVGAFNNRLYFWDGKSPGFWYGTTLGISGALSFFDFSMVTQEGGNLIAVEVLSYDGGTGMQAYTCFFLTSGEILLYSGTDPSNTNNWSLVGRYLIPPPVGIRAIARYGGDVYLTTTNDHQQLTKLLSALRLGETPPLTKASGAVRLAWQQGSNLTGWQALYYPFGQRIIYNVPNPDGTFSQHVYNTSTQAWCRFRAMKSYCWAVFGDNLYFGSDDGAVIQADTGSSDNGTVILAQGQQAWNTLQSPLKKRVTAIRPVVEANGVASFNFGLGFDYQPSGITVPDATVVSGHALIWGASLWGSPTVWGGTGVTDPRWHIAGGEGAAIGLSLTANTLVNATWIKTDLMIEPGSAL